MTNVIVEKDKCVGCRICELACSYHHSTVFSPERSSIKIAFSRDGGLCVNVMQTCDCRSEREALCIEFCPVSAIEFRIGNAG